MALARAQKDLENVTKRSLMGRFASLFSKRPDVSRARKAERPPLLLGPEQINLEPGGPAEAAPTPVAPTVVPGGGSLGIEIVTRPQRETDGEAASPDSSSDKQAGD